MSILQRLLATTHPDWCQVPHPDHVNVRCSRVKGHVGTHRARGPGTDARRVEWSNRYIRACAERERERLRREGWSQ